MSMETDSIRRDVWRLEQRIDAIEKLLHDAAARGNVSDGRCDEIPQGNQPSHRPAPDSSASSQASADIGEDEGSKPCESPPSEGCGAATGRAPLCDDLLADLRTALDGWAVWAFGTPHPERPDSMTDAEIADQHKIDRIRRKWLSRHGDGR